MSRKKLHLAIILLLIGIIGIISTLTMDISLPVEVERILISRYSPTQIKLLTLINPIMLLIISVVVGTLLYQKVNLKVSIIEKTVGIVVDQPNYSEILKYGITGGVITGVTLILVVLIYKSLIPLEYNELSQTLQPTLAARLLYGGLTEEILLRFGLMTLIVWLSSKLYKGTQKSITYWTGIIVAAIIFAIAHFPAAFQLVETPSLTLLSYILIGNSIGGIVFGWLYWKKGLEGAFIAHMVAHVVLVSSKIIIL